MNDASPQIELDQYGRKIYKPDGAVLANFIRDRKNDVVIIRGPIGSGTSSASCMKLWSLACEQAPGRDGVRRSRWLIIRNTFPELETTTLKTWLFWFPEEIFGQVKRSKPMQHVIKTGDVEAEFIFLALDDEDSIKKVRSLEITGAWINELEFIPKSIVNEVISRCGRYPPRAVASPTWYGVIADLNAPTEDHWLPQMTGDVPPPPDVPMDDMADYEMPEGWVCYVQPPALIEEIAPDGKTVMGYTANPLAENTKWLPDGFYEKLCKGKSRTWIDSRLMNRITLHVEGKKVWVSFVPETHIAKRPLLPVLGHAVWVGLDFWRSPAAVFAQLIGNRWFIQNELNAEDMGATRFAPMVKRMLETKYPGCPFKCFGDPKGQDKGQTDDRTAYEIFRGFQVPVWPAPVKLNSIQVRLEAVRYALDGMIDGQPRFLISPDVRVLKVAMAGGYVYRKIAGTHRYSDEPDKGRYSHVCDALQYMMLGGGEGRTMVSGVAAAKPAPINVRRGNVSRRRA